MAASFQNNHCGDWRAEVFNAEKSGTVRTNNVSDGSNSSAGGIAARVEKVIANSAQKMNREKFPTGKTNLFFIRLLICPAWRFEIAIRIVRIVGGIGKGVAMIEKIFHQFDRNRKTESLAKSDFHVCHADDFAREIEQRAAAVAGVDLRARLQI